jgi:thioredoxin 2
MATSTAGLVVKCLACGASNRVKPDAALGKAPVCGKCKTPLPVPSGQPVELTDANFAQVVENSPLPVLIDMWAAWCGPCRMIAPTIDALASDLAGRVLVAKLDVDANPHVSSRYRVQSIPTLLIIKNGREVDRLVGAQSRDAILRKLQPLLDR